MRKQQFTRPTETNFSLYEGRTRGKKMKYTFSEDDDEIYSDNATRRSTRNTRNHTPVEPAGPTITQSGRQVKARHGGAYGESMLSGAQPTATASRATSHSHDEQDEDEDVVSRRPRRAAATKNQNGKRPRDSNIHGYNSVDDLDDEDDASEQDYGDDDEEDEHVPVESDVDEPVSDDDEEMEDVDAGGGKDSMIVKLPVKTPTPEKKTNGVKLTLKYNSPTKQKDALEIRTDASTPTVQDTVKVNGVVLNPDGDIESKDSAKQDEVPPISSAVPVKSPLPTTTNCADQEKTNGLTFQSIDVGSGGN